ncbi:MAG: NAD(P)H-dependent oxidoreductase [Ideonella sp.]|nr:MAG: NAD(P)H-dependent oxidoreductase [Burkholderiaceae bacterium]MBE7424670.1 NAD(P)H-dependent oxidoreductase [Ideonella sp.]
MSEKLDIGIIIGSTREARFGHKAAQWLQAVASRRGDMRVDLIDLKNFDLPLFNEKASNLWLPSEDPRAVAWQKRIAEFDGYLVVTAEYNRSMTGALKNAFDQAYNEWNHKPIGFMGYGGLGAARAIEHARLVAIELQMVPVRTAVHLSGGDFMAAMKGQRSMHEVEAHLLPAAADMLDQVAWWGEASRAARDGRAKLAANAATAVAAA